MSYKPGQSARIGGQLPAVKNDPKDVPVMNPWTGKVEYATQPQANDLMTHGTVDPSLDVNEVGEDAVLASRKRWKGVSFEEPTHVVVPIGPADEVKTEEKTRRRGAAKAEGEPAPVAPVSTLDIARAEADAAGVAYEADWGVRKIRNALAAAAAASEDEGEVGEDAEDDEASEE